ncbi:MAG: amidohydrolase family protein, partial [Gammaproteobacteria bacterium]|nr:amidohydrolase family protein [Gammaproteobacteria bacterium]
IGRASEKGYDQQGRFVHADCYASASAQVQRAHSIGVELLAGTDNIDTYVFSGSSLHDELAMLVDAGLTPLEALQTATINPAKFAELDHEFGSVEVGKQGDLLLLNANPLSDIRHTADIFGVLFAGQYFDQKALETLDQYAVDMAQSPQVNVRFLYDILASPLMRTQLAD